MMPYSWTLEFYHTANTSPKKNPFQSNTMLDYFLKNHPGYRAKLSFLYMTPTKYKFRIHETNILTIMHMHQSNYPISPFTEKELRLFEFRFNFPKSTQHDLNTL